VRIDPTGHAILVNAGHCQPYLDGRELELPAGLPLGLVERMAYDEIALAIAHGQQLTLVSDGVVEAGNHHGELYGFDRLSQLMRERPTAEHVANTAVDFGQDDDITVLTSTRLPATPAQPRTARRARRMPPIAAPLVSAVRQVWYTGGKKTASVSPCGASPIWPREQFYSVVFLFHPWPPSS
jgi:hypothetical protein